MAKRDSASKSDRVFVLRLWRQDGGTSSRWLTEVKEIGATRHSDKQCVVDNLSAALEIIRRWLDEPSSHR